MIVKQKIYYMKSEKLLINKILRNSNSDCYLPLMRANTVSFSFFDQFMVGLNENSCPLTIVVLLAKRELYLENAKYRKAALNEAREIELKKKKKKKKKSQLSRTVFRNYGDELTPFEKMSMKKCLHFRGSGYKVILSGDDPTLIRCGENVCKFSDIPQQKNVFYWVPYYIKRTKALCSRLDVFCVNPKGIKTNKILLKPRNKFDKHIHIAVHVTY